MNETRRLDVLAIIGGILAIAMVFYISSHLEGGTTDFPKARAALLKHLPVSDLKADIELMMPANAAIDVKPSVDKIRQAAERFPNSARLQFRLGTYANDSQALRRAVELDPKNALPLYFLASKAASMDETLALLRDANLRKNITEYPLPYKGGPLAEMVISSVNAEIGFPIYLSPRTIARSVGKHALELQNQGRTDEALEALKQVKDMGWRFAKRENSTIMDLMVGTAVVGKAEKYEKQIYTAIGSKAGLAKVRAERERLDYLSAGSRDYLSHANDKMVSSITKRIAFFIPVVFMGIAQLLILLVWAIWWGILLLRSRKQPGSEMHLEATKAFSAGRLVKLYALAFVPAAAVFAMALVLFPNSDNVAADVLVYGAALIFPLILLIRAHAVYRQAGNEIGKSIPDKREFQRRMLGVQGGAMVFLVILGLLIAGGVKTATGSYPWDVQSYISKLRREEPRFVTKLLAGKVKVPVNSKQ